MKGERNDASSDLNVSNVSNDSNDSREGKVRLRYGETEKKCY